MIGVCKFTLQKSFLQKINSKSSCYLSKITVLNPALTSQINTAYCSQCGGDVTKKEWLSQDERGLHHFPYPTRRFAFADRSARIHSVYSKKKYSLLGSTSTSTSDHSFSISRNFSTTCRTLSTSPSLEAAVLAAKSTSTSKEILFGDFFPIYGAEKVIVYFHQITGLPWWFTIILTAFMLRVVVMIPFTVHSYRNMAKLQNLQPEVKEKAERLKLEVSMAMHQFGWDQKRARMEYNKNFKRILNELYIRDNCHPMKGIAAFWLQMSVWLSVSYALRNMSTRAADPNLEGHDGCKDLSEQGLAWFSDLTAADSTWLLPLMMGTVTLFNVEVGYLSAPEVTRFRKWLTYGLRCGSLIFIPLSSLMPCSMVLYWISSGTFAAVQSFLFEYSPFRRLLSLPKSNTESNNPLRSLGLKAKARYWSK
ncbi:unnamed protein product [Candidula unifasciata]|uniref:Membrane insertase YidC/Oxa/ALB C-terminal domain-containing protein n=1 Tax=Candidula unifasciata TaxID=100452 RepID=A0A8S3ZS86_9EUPU|nr:unnamed protein product [Candidula unifasciata]